MSTTAPAARHPVVLDTDVVSELMRTAPDAHVATWVAQLSPAPVHTTSVTLAEVRFDAQIAAICRVHRAGLATRNTADFDDLGLDLIDPWIVDI